MVKKLTESERRKLLTTYNRRENANRHTENALALIKRFGTKKQINEARKRSMKFKGSNIGISERDFRWFYEKGHKPHYKKLVKPLKK